MFEQQIINDYRLGKNQGIVEAPSCFYLPVRITGTGTTTRVDENGEPYEEERLKSLYFNQDALKHCASLPILENHPKSGLLDSESIKEAKIVGQTIDAWYKGDEIWGLARVYDKSLMDKFGKELNSTSPGVLVYKCDIISDDKQKEGPAEINHLAFVEQGHWDQVENSKGFEIEKRSDMATEIPLNDTIEPIRADNAEVLDNQPPLDNAEVLDNHHEQPTLDNAHEETLDNAVEVLDEEIEVLDEEVEVLDNKAPLLDSEEVEILDSAEDEEVIVSDNEEAEDREREAVLDSMREACDSAHPSLKVKMPRIENRETKRSIVSKFITRNPSFVSPKYSALRMDSMTSELADEVLKSSLENIKNASEKLGVKKTQGFVPSRYGFVDPNF